MLAQQFLGDQLLVAGRPFYIRWVGRWVGGRVEDGRQDVTPGNGAMVGTQQWQRRLQRQRCGAARLFSQLRFTNLLPPPSCHPCRRLWAVLVGADPARAYLYDGGVVVFGQQQRLDQAADALIVNLWTQASAGSGGWEEAVSTAGADGVGTRHTPHHPHQSPQLVRMVW